MSRLVHHLVRCKLDRRCCTPALRPCESGPEPCSWRSPSTSPERTCEAAPSAAAPRTAN